MKQLFFVEIGCADYADLRFDIRVDIKPTLAVTDVADMRDLSFLADHSVGFIKSAATLEHVDRAGQVQAIKEFHRVLVPCGMVWIQTPDLDTIQANLNSADDDVRAWARVQMTGGQRDEFDHHYGLVNKDALNELFSENGFRVLLLELDGGSLDLRAEAIRQ